MFEDSNAFSGFAVDDVDAARRFYRDTLGLEVSDIEGGMLQLRLRSGASILIYRKPDHQPATYTILNFRVAEVEQAVRELDRRGVRMERYDLPGMEADALGIHRGEGPAIAWFTDPAGNVLSVMQG